MPTARLVATPVPTARARRRSDILEQERVQIRDLLQQARESGKVIELALAAEERDETVKMHYRAVAKETGDTIRFQTAQSRPYRNGRGRDEYEAEVMHVFVKPKEPATRPRQPRRRKTPASV